MSMYPRLAIVAVMMAFGLLGSLSKGHAEEGKLIIPTTIVLTGPGAFTGEGWKAGAEMALSEINSQGGIHGKTVELSYIDTQGTPQGGIAAIRKIIQQDNAYFVLAAGTSTDVTSAIPMIQTTFKNTPVYVSVASDPRVSEKFSRNIFTGTPPQKYIVESLAQFSVDKIKPKSLVLFSGDAAWCIANRPLLISEFEKRGVKVVKTITYNGGDTDFFGPTSRTVRIEF